MKLLEDQSAQSSSNLCVNDLQLWTDAVGGVKKGHIYGTGNLSKDIQSSLTGSGSSMHSRPTQSNSEMTAMLERIQVLESFMRECTQKESASFGTINPGTMESTPGASRPIERVDEHTPADHAHQQLADPTPTSS